MEILGFFKPAKTVKFRTLSMISQTQSGLL